MTPAVDSASRGRFGRALEGIGAAGDEGGLLDELTERYAEPHRYYHTLAHVEHCLRGLDRFIALAERPPEVELALWFHDVVYDPRAKDNEVRSAELAALRLLDLGAPREAVDRIAAHIVATRDHRSTDLDGQLVIDLDLAILGADWPSFVAFEEAIREEYRHVPALLFESGRKKVLRRFAKRAQIFSHKELRDELEARARDNLRRRLAGEGKARR